MPRSLVILLASEGLSGRALWEPGTHLTFGAIADSVDTDARGVVAAAEATGWGGRVGLDHVMAAHVTGNLVVLASDVAQGFTGQDSLKVVILPVFFLGVMLVTLVHDRFIARIAGSGRQLARLLECEAGLIALSGLLGAWVSLTGVEQDFWIALLVVTPVTFGMAMQNAAHRLDPGGAKITLGTSASIRRSDRPRP